MATLFGLARLGKDAVLRHTANSDPVTNLALAFNYGRKGQDGKRPTQWVEGVLWGAYAEAMIPYLLKGAKVVVTIDDVHIETYQGTQGEGSKLTGTVSKIELAGDAPQQQQAAPQSSAREQSRDRQAAASRPAPKPAPNFSDMDDDIPFLLSNIGVSVMSSSKQFSRSKHGRNSDSEPA